MSIEIDERYIEEKVEAYNVAIDALRNHESESDTAGSGAMRLNLAKKLNREINRWLDKRGK